MFSQSKEKGTSLFLIVNEIEKKFDCRFSYRNKDLEGISIERPNEEFTLPQTIEYLQKQTSLQWIFLNETSLVVKAYMPIGSQIEICGTLKSVTNKAITNATIQSKSTSTLSDEKGSFRMLLDTSDTAITIRCVGYKNVVLSAAKFQEETCKTIVLMREIQELGAVTLKNYLVKGIDKKTDGSIHIDYTNFGLLPGLIEPDLLQTIQALPGVASVEETVADINVRGGTNDQNLILWDGIKMYQSGHFFGLISAFNPYLTKDVTLIKNGSSAVFGGGVSSVISMNTSNKINNEFDASIGVNMISSDGYVDTPLGDKTSLQVSFRRSINDFLKTPTYTQYFEKAFQDSELINNLDDTVSTTEESFSFYDTSIRWLYQPTPKDLIKINGLLIRNNLGFQENAVVNQEAIARESTVKQNNSAGSFWYQRKWSENFESDVLIYGTQYVLEAVNFDIPNNQRLLQENSVLESGIKVNTLYRLTPQLKLESGYQFAETGITNLRDVNNPNFRDRIKEVLRISSVFSEGSFISSTNDTYIRLGVRLNHFNKFNTLRLEPRLSLSHKIDHRFTIELLAELKSQAAVQVIESQNDFLGIENRKWVLANGQDIPILKSQQISTGLVYTYKNWLVNGDVYIKNVDGIIVQSQGFQNQLEFESGAGSYRVKGVDFLINKRINRLRSWLGYSYADNVYTFNTLSKVNFPNTIDIRHALTVGFAYSVGGLKFSGGVSWHSGKPTTRPEFDNPILDNGTINYQHPNSGVLEDYLRWDTSFTYDFSISSKVRGIFGVSMWNIFDNKNIINNYYRIHSTDDIMEIKQVGLGVTPNAVFRINF